MCGHDHWNRGRWREPQDGAFTPVWHGLCTRATSASGSVPDTSEIGTVILSPIVAPAAQRLSSTAVYPPCPRMSPSSLDGCASGHGGYTATG